MSPILVANDMQQKLKLVSENMYAVTLGALEVQELIKKS